MQELQTNGHYKVVKVELPAGTNIPRHFATSDAYVIVEAGNALLICKSEPRELTRGSNLSIQANMPHVLKVVTDFKAYIILANNAFITYPVLETVI